MMIANNLFNTQALTALITAALTLAAYSYGLFFTGGFETHFAPAFIMIAALLIMGLSQLGETPMQLNDRGLLITALLWIAGIAATLAMASIYEVALLTSYVLLVFPFALLAFVLLGAVPRQFHACGIALLAALGVTGIWAAVQSFVLSDNFGGRANVPLYNPNNMASLLNLGLLPACALFAASVRWPMRLLGALCALACLVGIIATQSRGGMLIAGGALVLFCLVLWGTGLPRKRASFILPVLLGLVFIAGLVIHPDIADRFANFFESGKGDLAQRVARWQGAFHLLMANDRPIFGLGPGTFYQYFPPHRITGADEASSYFAHMDPLQFLIEMGVIGLIIFYLPLLWLLTAAGRLIITPFASYGETAADRLAAWACIISLLGLYAHAHISFPFYVMAVLICAGFLFALLYHKLPPRDGPTRTISLHPVLRGICILFVFLVAASAGRAGLAQHHIKGAAQYEGFISTQSFRKALAQARFYAPESFNEPRLLAVKYKLKLGGEPPAFPGADPSQLLDTAEAYNPVDPRIPYFRAQWQAQQDNRDHVKAHFLRKALERDPAFFPARQKLIEQLIDDARYMDAYKLVIEGGRHPHKSDEIAYFRKRAAWLEQKLASNNTSPQP